MYFSTRVLRRLVTLISTQATLEAEASAAQKQAKSATEAAKVFMEDKENKVTFVYQLYNSFSVIVFSKQLICRRTTDMKAAVIKSFIFEKSDSMAKIALSQTSKTGFIFRFASTFAINLAHLAYQCAYKLP